MSLLLDDLKQAFSKTQEGPVKALKEKAWNQFLQKKLPEKGNESFQYMPLREFYAGKYEIPGNNLGNNPGINSGPFSGDIDQITAQIYPECKKSYLVFENGKYRADLSCPPKQIVILPFPLAMASYGHFINHRFLSQLSEENDPFALLNAALFDEGMFVFVPPKLKLETPIQVLHLTTGTSFPRIQLFLGEQAEVKWLTTSFSNSQGAFWTDAVMDIALEEGSFFHHVDLLPSSDWHFQSVRATLKSKSRFHSLSHTKGSKVYGKIIASRLWEKMPKVHFKRPLDALWKKSFPYACSDTAFGAPLPIDANL